MLEELARVLVEQCLLNGTGAIIVGVSGGPDSLCLMDAMHQLGYPIVAAHFNHRLRPEAESEAGAVKAAARRLSLPFAQGTADVRSRARGRRVSIEQAARDCRYGFLFEEARVRHAQAVAVGHTADDQVETLLMHLIRGAGLNGLTGMSYRTVLPNFDPSVPIVRPLLGVWREATVAYCESHALDAVHDPSNESREYFRNRVRHELIPLLAVYNPRIREALWRTAGSLSSDQAVLAEHVDAEWKAAIIRETAEYVMFDSSRLVEASVPIQRLLMRLAVQHLVPGEETSYELLNRAASFVSDLSRRREDLAGGIELFREPGVLYVSRGETALPSDAWPQMPRETDSIPVVVPGRVALAAGWQLTTEIVDLQPPGDHLSNAETNLFQARLDADSLSLHMELRVRRRGDTFEPLGLHGHSQKLSDFFVNEKLPARARARWPLLCDGDSIAWVPGFRPSDSCRLRRQTRRAVRLEVSRAAHGLVGRSRAVTLATGPLSARRPAGEV